MKCKQCNNEIIINPKLLPQRYAFLYPVDVTINIRSKKALRDYSHSDLCQKCQTKLHKGE